MLFVLPGFQELEALTKAKKNYEDDYVDVKKKIDAGRPAALELVRAAKGFLAGAKRGGSDDVSDKNPNSKRVKPTAKSKSKSKDDSDDQADSDE